MLVVFGAASLAQSPPQTAPRPAAQPVPVIDGGVGPCTLELTVATGGGKPAGAATVKVHIAYGFGGFHRLDLEAGTNVDGKVKFTGLPSRVRRPPLEFHASKGDLAGIAVYDPETECQGKHDITPEKRSAQPE
jgi:hypothetical protein